MIKPWQGPSHPQHTLAQVRESASAWQGHAVWSEAGRDRWGLVLNLPLPPLPMVGVRFAMDGQAWRGSWVQVGGVPSLWAQPRTHREKLSPWFLVPLETLAPADQVGYWAHWLDHVAQAASRLSSAQARRACPQADLAGRLSGPSWALLSGRAKAASMLNAEDFSTR